MFQVCEGPIPSTQDQSHQQQSMKNPHLHSPSNSRPSHKTYSMFLSLFGYPTALQNDPKMLNISFSVQARQQKLHLVYVPEVLKWLNPLTETLQVQMSQNSSFSSSMKQHHHLQIVQHIARRVYGDTFNRGRGATKNFVSPNPLWVVHTD